MFWSGLISGLSAQQKEKYIPFHASGVDYILVGNDTNKQKDALIFLQGSLPIPLVINMDNGEYILLPFNYQKLSEQYHVYVITMPHTPIAAQANQLNKQYCYIPNRGNPNKFSEEYLKANILETYVSRTNTVINDIKQKHWNANKVHLIGHSQGAKIAAVVASNNNSVSTVAFLGFNAFGRFDEQIRKLRLKQLPQKEYESQLNLLYNDWKHIKSNADNWQDGLNSWVSFSIDYTPYLLNINCPMFIGYGTQDIGASNSDLIPLKLVDAGKTNFTIKPYVGLDHNFFEFNDGKPDRSKGHWAEVVEDVVEWIKY